MSKISVLNGKPIYLCTPEELRAAAGRSYAAKDESYARSDSDGFLSQWASGITAQLYSEQAEINESGGTREFRVLVDSDGNIVSRKIEGAHYVNGSNGSFMAPASWVLTREQRATYGRWSIPLAGKSGKSRVQDQLGLREERRPFKAVAVIAGSGTGLSGCANAYVTARPLHEFGIEGN